MFFSIFPIKHTTTKELTLRSYVSLCSSNAFGSEKAKTIMILVKHSSIGLPDLNLGDAEVGVGVVVVGV